MFIQRKKVALLLLIFIAIPITIAFSAFKLSASKAAIAADENKTEYTLSDFVTVPDDGIDFNPSSEMISGELQPKESQVIKFSFAIKLLDLQAKKEIVVKFGIYPFTFSIPTSGYISVVKTNSNDSYNKDKEEYKSIIQCQANELLTISFDIAYKNISAFSVECNDSKVSKKIENGSLSKASIQFKLSCQKGNNIKMFDTGTKPKSTSLTVKNESGDIVSSVDTKALTRSEIVKAVETEQKKFIGFEYDSKLYKTADEIETINKNAVVTAKTMTLYMEYGARIRTIEPFGIRFAAVASYSVADYGIMLTTKDIAKNSDLFTLENLENSDVNYKIACKSQSKFKELLDKETGLSNFAIALVGTKGVRKANYNLVFAARAFAKIKYADGSVGTVYSNFGDDNCRSLYDVASKGLKNSNDKENYALYRDYCDGVIDITISKSESNISAEVGYESNLYSVTPTVENDNKTLSITFNVVKDGYNIADNVKCITINGKRIVGFKYDGGKIQIDITEFLS